jgi:uncharacterized protein YktA (UPF0223 family)
MSFTVTEKSIDFDRGWLSDETKDGAMYNIIAKFTENFEQSIENAESDYRDEPLTSVEGLDIEFSVEENSSGYYIVNFKTVESDGPILGFLGVFLDAASGYILLDNVKTNDYIPVMNFYKYLEDNYNIKINSQLMLSLMEKYKMAEKVVSPVTGKKREIRIIDIINIINSTNIGGSTGSIISKILNNEKQGTAKSSLEFVEQFLEPFKKVSKVMHSTISSSISGHDWSSKRVRGVDEMAAVDNDLVRFTDSMYQAHKLFAYNSNAFKYMNKNLSELKSGDERINHSLRNMSAMLHSSKGHRSSQMRIEDYRGGEFTFDKINKSESRLINMYDILEERKDESLLELDDIVFTASNNVSKKEMSAVEEKIGVKEYIGGATLAHLSKTLKGANDSVKDMIDEFYMDLEGFGNYLNDNTIGKLTDGIKKISRYYGRLLKMIDAAVR